MTDPSASCCREVATVPVGGSLRPFSLFAHPSTEPPNARETARTPGSLPRDIQIAVAPAKVLARVVSFLVVTVGLVWFGGKILDRFWAKYGGDDWLQRIVAASVLEAVSRLA